MSSPGTSVHPDTTGAPRSWDAGELFLQVPVEAIREVGLTAAAVFALIVFRGRVNPDGWPATHDEIADEIGGPKKRTVETATKLLRERGYVVAHRRNRSDSTLVWTPVWADRAPRDPGTADSAVSEAARSAVSSTKNRKKKPSPHPSHVDPPSAVAEPVESERDQEIENLCRVLADSVRGRGGLGRPTAADRRAAGELLTDPEYGGPAFVHAVLRYAVSHDFWRDKVTSLVDLKRHWDKLAVQAKPGIHDEEEHVRRERLRAFGPLPAPPAWVADGPPAAYLNWTRDCRQRIASGEVTRPEQLEHSSTHGLGGASRRGPAGLALP